MHSSLPDLPVPAWLARLTVETMQRDPFPLSDILQASLYYPAAGFDGDPVKHLTGKLHSYIYVDYGHTREQLTAALSDPGFRGYDILGRREVTEKELTPHGWTPQPPPKAEHRRPPGGWIKPPFCSWTVFQKQEPDPTASNKDRFSLLYLAAEGVAAYQALYTANQKFPACVAIIQPGTGFGGNWTDFRDPEQVFYQSILANPAGNPTHLLYGGIGQGDSYNKPCWPAYSSHVKSYEKDGGARVGLWSARSGDL